MGRNFSRSGENGATSGRGPPVSGKNHDDRRFRHAGPNSRPHSPSSKRKVLNPNPVAPCGEPGTAVRSCSVIALVAQVQRVAFGRESELRLFVAV